MSTFTFIIPVKPGGHVAAVEPLHRLSAGPFQFEVLIAEGCSPSRQRNRAALEAQGEILYFLDDDSRVAPDCLHLIEQAMTDSSTAVVGGPSLTPSDDSLIQQLFGCALASLFGAGAVRNRYRSVGRTRETTDRELILCNLALRRDTFLEAGGLDERLYPNEENELLDRIRHSGQKLVHVPELAVRRSQRRSLLLFVRQMHSYGRGRAQQTLIAGPGTIIGFIPLLFLCYLLLLPIAGFSRLYTLPLYAYLALDAIFTLAAIIADRSLSRMFLFLLFPVMHLSNGAGLLTGLLGGKQGRTRGTATGEAVIRRIKTFEQTVW